MDQRYSYWLDAFLALIFGALAACAVWIFEQTILLSEVIIPSLPGLFKALLPAFGGLVVGLVSYFGKIEASGGVVDVIAGANLRRRILSIPKNLIKPFLSSVAIATGNPVGSEAPTILIGSQAAALVAYYLKIPRRRKRMLIACGAAAGFSAAFGAPIAAVTFVIEVILSEFTVYGFVLITLASACAYLFARLLGMDSPLSPFNLAKFSWTDLGMAVVIGIVCVGVAYLWSKLLGFIEHKSHNMKYVSLWGPVAGGLVAGIIIFIVPEVAGPGYKVIGSLANGNIIWYAAIAMLFAKMVGTSAVLGMGGAGGDFAPAMFMGASVGSFVSNLFGGGLSTAVIAGVCAQLGATMHAPLTAIVLSVEMMGVTTALLPVAIAVVVSLLLSLRLIPRSLYHQKAHEKGILIQKTQFQQSGDTAIEEVMSTNVISVDKGESVKKAIDLMRHNGISGLVVTDKKVIFGIITLSDLRNKVTGNDLDKEIADFCQTDVVTGTKETTLSQAWEMMRENQIGRIPIVTKNGSIVGIVTKRDLLELAARRTHEEDKEDK